MTPTQTIEIHASTEVPPVIQLPQPLRIFAERHARFAALSQHHSLSDWLAYLGRLTQAQHEIAQTLDGLAPPPTEALDRARQHGMPPLAALSYPRPDNWTDIARRLAEKVADDSPQAMRPHLAALGAMTTTELDAIADALLDGRIDPDALPETTIVAAALQTVWTTLAARLDAEALVILDPSELCPCCGSLPVASIIRTSAQVNNLRYLHCSLCNTEWNVPRATCTACGTDRDVSYRQIDGDKGSVRAECCDHCKSYLKIMAQEKDSHIDPVADDLATLTLDLLVDEAGYSRSGPNLLLLGGSG